MFKSGKRVLLIIIALCLIVSTLVGCGSSNESGKSNNKKKVTLTIMGTSDSLKEIERTKIAEAFQTETGIRVDYQLVQDSQYHDLLNTKLNSGTAPDIFVAQSGANNLKPKYNPEKNCVDLSNEPWVERYDKLAKENSTYNGKVYCQTLWNTNSVWAMIYNKRLFEAHNLQVPTTYEEFDHANQTLKAAGIIPVYECAADSWHPVCSLIEMFVKIESDNPGTYAKLNNNTLKVVEIPEAKLLVEQFKEVGQNYSGDGYLSNEFANSIAALSDGTHAMTVNRVDAIAQFDKDYADGKYKSEDFGAFLVPYIDNQIRNVNPAGNSKFIFSGSENIEEAKLYLDFIARPENLDLIMSEEPSFSWLPFEGITPRFIEAEKEFYAKYTDALAVPQSGMLYIDPQWGDMAKDVQALYTGQLTALELLENIDQRRATMAKEAANPDWD